MIKLQKMEFIDKMNEIKSQIPVVKDFVNKGFDDDYANAILNEYQFELCNDVKGQNQSSFLSQLINNVKFNNFTFFGLSLSEFKEYEDYVLIGFRDVENLIILKETGEVALVDELFSDILYLISPNIETFIDIIPVLIKYDLMGYFGEKYTVEKKMKTYAELETLISDDKYLFFYKYSLGLSPAGSSMARYS